MWNQPRFWPHRFALSASTRRSFRWTVLWLLCQLIPGIAEPQIYLDQAGYRPESPKFFFVHQPADSFYLYAATSHEPCFRGAVKLWRTNDPATGWTIYRGDFSALAASGQFYVEMPGIGRSHDFPIAATVYQPVYRQSLKGFYFQRCGSELKLEHANVYLHARCHFTDGLFHSSTGLSGFHDGTGGWHDAGDYGKYVVNAGVTVGTLLLAFELFPDRFQQDDLNIPESSNGIPDLLDEVRYELEWLFKMQDPNGGVYHKLTREQFEGFVMPQRDTDARYLYQISSAATADFAGMMARAARIFQPFDSLFARRCLTSAEAAWQYLEVHPNIIPAGGFKNPDGTKTGEYGDGQDFDERLWAAAELFITTGAEQYHQYFISRYDARGLITGPMGWQDVYALALLSYLTSRRPEASSAIQSRIHGSLIQYCQNLVTKRNQSGFQVLLEPGEYFWGCHGYVLNKAVLLIIGYELSKNQDFLAKALDQLHYILGANAHGMCFVTGIGKKSVRHPHHRPSAADNIPEPVPGLLAGGPNQQLQDAVLQSHFNSSTPPALCYIDDVGSYASNEIAINWNAPLVFVAGYFAMINSAASGIESGEAPVPKGIRLLQNYPNPFAETTTIVYQVDLAQEVQLKIYDLLGRVVVRTTLVAAPNSANRFEWNGRNLLGEAVPSGIYVYQLETNHDAITRKLICFRRAD